MPIKKISIAILAICILTMPAFASEDQVKTSFQASIGTIFGATEKQWFENERQDAGLGPWSYADGPVWLGLSTTTLWPSGHGFSLGTTYDFGQLVHRASSKSSGSIRYQRLVLPEIGYEFRGWLSGSLVPRLTTGLLLGDWDFHLISANHAGHVEARAIGLRALATIEYHYRFFGFGMAGGYDLFAEPDFVSEGDSTPRASDFHPEQFCGGFYLLLEGMLGPR